jgi:transcriptional antiterminator
MIEANPGSLDSKQLSAIVTEHQKRIVVVKEELEGIRIKKEAIRKETLGLSGAELADRLKLLQAQSELESQKIGQLIFLLESSGEIGDKVVTARQEEADAIAERLIREAAEKAERLRKERRDALSKKWEDMSEEERKEWFLQNGN